VRGNRDAFLPDLAMSLNNQANLQSEVGKRAEALASIEEAVEHYRELVRGNRDAFLPNLVTSYSTWGLILDGQEGIEKFAEGLQLITPFAQKLPQAHLPLAVNLRQTYIQACQKAGVEPDAALLQPIAELMQAERAASDEPES